MNKLILAIILLLSFNVEADTLKSEQCTFIRGVAKSIMTLRQDNVKKGDVLEYFDRAPLFKPMVIDAYNRPLYSSKGAKDMTISRFALNIYTTCLGVKNVGEV